MRMPFGKLMDELEKETDKSVTLGQLAEKYNVDVERIMDALDAIKERNGIKSYIGGW